MRSAPQKQPIPTIACSSPSGNGGSSGVPRTSWRAGTDIRSARPGRASPAETMCVGLLKRCMPPRVRMEAGLRSRAKRCTRPGARVLPLRVPAGPRAERCDDVDALELASLDQHAGELVELRAMCTEQRERVAVRVGDHPLDLALDHGLRLVADEALVGDELSDAC